MSSKMYGKLLPDYGDLDNKTKTASGYRVYIIENDGGISLQMIHANDDPITSVGSSVFMNIDEARELIKGLEKAIKQAKPKKANHPTRGTLC